MAEADDAGKSTKEARVEQKLKEERRSISKDFDPTTKSKITTNMVEV